MAEVFDYSARIFMKSRRRRIRFRERDLPVRGKKAQSATETTLCNQIQGKRRALPPYVLYGVHEGGMASQRLSHRKDTHKHTSFC